MHQHLVDAFVDATLRWHSLETNSGERWTHNGPRSDAAAAPLLLVRDTSKFGATSVNDVKLGVGGEREAKPGDTLFVRTAGTNRWPSSSSPQKGGTDNCKFSDGPEEVGIGVRE